MLMFEGEERGGEAKRRRRLKRGAGGGERVDSEWEREEVMREEECEHDGDNCNVEHGGENE